MKVHQPVRSSTGYQPVQNGTSY